MSAESAAEELQWWEDLAEETLGLLPCPDGGEHAAGECDPYCPADDPRCFGTRCSPHDHCEPPAVEP